MNNMRSHYSGTIDSSLIGEEISLTGWVHRRRDHGGVIFIDLRDREGIAQVVFNPEDSESFVIAEKVRLEYVLRVVGKIEPRPEGTINPDMKTGEVELIVSEVQVLNTAQTPPFMLDDNNINEDNRLKFRYMDLRRQPMQDNLRLRAKVTQNLRAFLDSNGFLDIETPMLTRATPEGARDYLVPSRTHQGKFFALPQSPQLFKQLLMMSGFDKYYQIVRCFRDEDLRADRQPEFTQLDIETSFVNEDEIIQQMESMIDGLFKQVLDVKLPSPIPRISYAEAMDKYGSDRPDLRSKLELTDIADLLENVEFKVFSAPAKDPDGKVAALKVPNGNVLSRKQIDDYTKFVGIYGAKGLAYIKVNDITAGIEGLQSPILKFLPDDAVLEIMSRVEAKSGDLVFFGADRAKIVNESLGALRVKVSEDLNLMQSGWHPVWVVDFPMFDKDDKTGDFSALHHPFTAPRLEDVELLETAPEKCLSRAYDLVLNGNEVGGGSIRIHQSDLQEKVLSILGIAENEARDKFGFLLDALKYGCPPHGGMAFGLDRLVMLMAGAETIRDVMAFPKTQTANCLLTGAPDMVNNRQLRELGIKLLKTEST